MDLKIKEEAAGIGAKLITFIGCVLPPLIMANLTHWAASVITEKKISKRARIAIFLGSFGIASLVHWLFISLNIERFEWVAIWCCTMGTPSLLKFLILEFGDMLKDWCRKQLEYFAKSSKNEDVIK